jgi:hypothetical protein
MGGGGIAALAWFRSDRLLALRYGCGASGFSLAVVDPVAGRKLKIEPIEGDVVRLAATTTQLVAVVAARAAIAPSRLIVFDVDGVVRTRTLETISAGMQRGPEDVESYAEPGLAGDGHRAFVVPAMVDVASGRVVGTRTARVPRLLREQASPFWGNGY